MQAVVDGIQHNLGAIAGGAIVIGLIQVCYLFLHLASLLSIGINPLPPTAFLEVILILWSFDTVFAQSDATATIYSASIQE